MLKISFTGEVSKADVLVLGVEGAELSKEAKEWDKKLHGALQKSLEVYKFKGKIGEVLPITTSNATILLVGLSNLNKSITSLDLEKSGGSIYVALKGFKFDKVYVNISDIKYEGSIEEALAYMANGAFLRSWNFSKYFTTESNKEKVHHALEEIIFYAPNAKKAQEQFATLHSVSKGVCLTREAITETPNNLYPETFANMVKENLEPLGVKVEILEEKKIKELGMNALLGVGQGSVHRPRVVVLEWKGGSNKDPIAFVGKGVTFDSGGLSLKPANSMEDMKYDMGGAGVVMGLMASLASRKAKVNAVGVLAMVENMPDGAAQRPGDVVKSMSGQTIEVLNTDAEGRLILADVLWYAQERFKPSKMVNLATLTGAVVVALGHEHAGLFSNNDDLAEEIKAAGIKVGDKVWRMPMGPEYDKQIDSKIADMQNIGNVGGAGSITAAQFLGRFVKKETAWAHLDIAGTTWSTKPRDLSASGATGFGVRLLNQWVLDSIEK